VKQREAELLAARNFLLPRIDLVAAYRWRGFGDDLFGDGPATTIDPGTGDPVSLPNAGSAFANLFQGDLEGWRYGIEFSTPLGRRQGHAAVRNAQLRLARERALLRDQERLVSVALSDAFGEIDRAYVVTRAEYNRTIASLQRVDAAIAKYNAGEELLQFVVEAQSRAVDADSQYYRALVDYNLAVLNLHYERGTYLDYVGVYLSEGPWSRAARRSFAKEARRLYRPRLMDYCIMKPGRVSDGPYPQAAPRFEPAQETPEAVPTESLPPSGPAEQERLPEQPEMTPLEIPPGPQRIPPLPDDLPRLSLRLDP
jgi:hypothetical protein